MDQKRTPISGGRGEQYYRRLLKEQEEKLHLQAHAVLLADQAGRGVVSVRAVPS